MPWFISILLSFVYAAAITPARHAGDIAIALGA